MTAKQLHFLKPGDRVRLKPSYGGRKRDVYPVEMVVLHIFADRQVVGAVELKDGLDKCMCQRNEMLAHYELETKKP